MSAQRKAKVPEVVRLSVPADVFDCIRAARERLLTGWMLERDMPGELATGVLDALSELQYADEHARRLLSDEGAVSP